MSTGSEIAKRYSGYHLGRECGMTGCGKPIQDDNRSGYCLTHKKRKCRRCGAIHHAKKTMCLACRKALGSKEE